jgi:hypothetical protein
VARDLRGPFTTRRAVGGVQGAQRELEILLVDQHADLDLRGRDHLDVDALLGQRANIVARTPAWLRMPTPITDTLTTLRSAIRSW